MNSPHIEAELSGVRILNFKEVDERVLDVYGGPLDAEEKRVHLNPAIQRARSALQNGGCSSFFAGTSMSAMQALNEIGKRWEVEFQGNSLASLLGGARSAQTRPLEPFMNIPFRVLDRVLYSQRAGTTINMDTWLNETSGQNSIQDEQVATLLHELGHAISLLNTGSITGGFINADGLPSQTAANLKNSQQIRERCGLLGPGN